MDGQHMQTTYFKNKLPLQLQWSYLNFIFSFIPRSKYMKFIYPLLGCSWGQHPIKNEKLILFTSQKDKMADGNPRRLCVSYSHFSEADFWGEGTGHFRSSVQQIWKLIWKSLNLLQFSTPCKKSLHYKKGTWNCRSPLNGNIFIWIVRRALNAISDRNKTETLFARKFLF